MTNRVNLEMSDQEYHADPALSSTGAWELVNGLPARFKYERDHGGRPDKKVYDVGHAAHSLVLGKGGDLVVPTIIKREKDADGLMADVVVEPDLWNTDAVKKAVQDIRAAGNIPMKRAEVEQVEAMAKAVAEHPTAGPLFEIPGDSEVSLFATDPDTGVALRARPDRLTHIRDDEPTLIIDLKTAVSASKRAFEKSCADYGYHLSAAMYKHVWRLIHGDKPVEFLHVVVEKESPYFVAVYQLAPISLALGERQMQQAIEVFRDCTESGVWPAYSDEITSIDVPSWAWSGAARAWEGIEEE